MYRKNRKLTSIVLLVCLSTMLLPMEGFAAVPTVKIVVSPNQTDINAGSEPIALTAQATGADLKYEWTLNGPGKIDNTDLPAVFYVVPEEISGKSAQAVVTVTITDKTGQETTESITFNILASSDQEKPSASQSEPKKGMSRNTKIALGVGALAAVGGITAVVAGGGGDGGDKNPFSGTFKGQTFSDVTSRGNTYTMDYTLNLQQAGASITGTAVETSTLINCCTNVITVPVSGSTDGDNSANLSWGEGEGRCECAAWIWNSVLYANSGHVTLIGKNTIRFDQGAEYFRTKRLQRSDGTVVDEAYHLMGRDFIRQ